jgi:hypothetical protein
MKPNAPTCFISYSHQDIDRGVLNYIVFTLKNIVHAT